MTETTIASAMRPRRAPDVEVCRRPDDGAIILRRSGRYVAVSERSLEIWNSFDGTVTLQELWQRHRGSTEPVIDPAFMDLTLTLADCGFVVPETLGLSPSNANRQRGGVNPPRSLLEGYMTFSTQRWIDSTYPVVRQLYRPVVYAGAALLACAGLVAFLLVTSRSNLEAGIAPIATLGLAICLAACAHEAAHAFTLRHFGGVVARAGIGWYWFAPTAFVDTSDAHLLRRGKRIAVCLAGPAMDVWVAGSSALVALCVYDRSLAAWCLTFAELTYLRFLWNINPLLETDWYYALTDVLRRPNLRNDGFALLLGRRSHGDLVSLMYGVGALLYAAIYVVFAVPSLVRATFAVWLAPIVPPVIIPALPFGAATIAALAIGRSVRKDIRGRAPQPKVYCGAA